jgi:hypothetical protein
LLAKFAHPTLVVPPKPSPAAWSFSIMASTAKDLLLPTEMASFLRACGKHDLSIKAFELSILVRPSAYAADINEHVVRIKHKKSRIEKDYIRHQGANWTTVFELDLLSGHFMCQLRKPRRPVGTDSPTAPASS